MTELTALTLAEQAGDALRSRRCFPAANSPKAHCVAIASAPRALNAFITETPERALAMAAASDARLARRGRAARRPAAGDQGSVLHQGRAHHGGSQILSDFVPHLRIHGHRKLWSAGAVMLGKPNMDEFAMGSSNETSWFGPVVKPVARERARKAPRRSGDKLVLARRFVGRFGGGGLRESVPGGDRNRYRRIDPPAGGLDRNGRHQADLWALLALGHRRLRLVARSGRADGAHGARRGDHAEGDGQRRSQGFDQRRRCRCRITRPGWKPA